MDAAALTAATGWQVVHRTRVDSTNDVAAALIGKEPPPFVVVADEQTKGRGRGGRTFASPLGGLYLSLVFPAASTYVPHHVVAGVAVAVAEAIESLVPVSCGIKWPNDVWIQERKVCGILIEAPRAGGLLVVGVGVNRAVVPPGLPDATTCLADHAASPPSRSALLRAVLARVDAVRLAWGSDALRRRWQRRLLFVGGPVTLTYRGARHDAILLAIDLLRGLHVRGADGEEAWLPAAHVQDLRPARVR